MLHTKNVRTDEEKSGNINGPAPVSIISDKI